MSNVCRSYSSDYVGREYDFHTGNRRPSSNESRHDVGTDDGARRFRRLSHHSDIEARGQMVANQPHIPLIEDRSVSFVHAGYNRYSDRVESDHGPAHSSHDSATECHIVVLDNANQKYVKSVEEDILKMGISVSVIALDKSADVAKTVCRLRDGGVLFAVVIHPNNVSTGSASVHVLFSQLKDEFFNVPMAKVLEVLQLRMICIFERHPHLPLPPTGRKQLQMAIEGRSLTALQYQTLFRLLRIKRDYAERKASETRATGSCHANQASDDLCSPRSRSHRADSSVVSSKAADIVQSDLPCDSEMSAEALELQQRVLKLIVQLGLLDN